MEQKRRLILVLDDDPTISVVVRGLLQSHPFDMRFVDTIEKAKSALGGAEVFDILLSDVHLPDGNSLDFFEDYMSIRPGLNIICMTKFNNETTTHRAWTQGAIEFIEKPIDKVHLMHALNAVIEGGDSPIKVEHRKLTNQLFHFVQDRDIPMFDHKRLVTNLGEDLDLCCVALQTYLENLDLDLKHIHSAVSEGDHSKAEGAIHKLKGASETVLVLQVVHALKQMEKTLKSGGELTEFDCHELNRVAAESAKKVKIWLDSVANGKNGDGEEPRLS